MTDAYAVYAISRLARWCQEGERFTPDNRFLGGACNRVMSGHQGEREVVFKFYGWGSGLHVGEPADRQRREWLALQFLSQTGLAPEPIQRDYEGGFSVFSKLPGRTLRREDSAVWRLAGPSFGALWPRVLARELDSVEQKLFRHVVCDGLSLAETVALLLQRSKWLLQRIGQPEDLSASLHRIEAKMPELLDGPAVLVRLDNNPGNLLQHNGISTRLIDWEQYWVATPIWQAGILLDRECAGMSGIMQGYQQAGGPGLDDHDALLAMAELSCWWRQLWNFGGWRPCHGPDASPLLSSDWQYRLRRRLAWLQEQSPAILARLDAAKS